MSARRFLCFFEFKCSLRVPITDCRTAVSGIEPKHVQKDVARTFEEVSKVLLPSLTEVVVGILYSIPQLELRIADQSFLERY